MGGLKKKNKSKTVVLNLPLLWSDLSYQHREIVTRPGPLWLYVLLWWTAAPEQLKQRHITRCSVPPHHTTPHHIGCSSFTDLQPMISFSCFPVRDSSARKHYVSEVCAGLSLCSITQSTFGLLNMILKVYFQEIIYCTNVHMLSMINTLELTRSLWRSLCIWSMTEWPSVGLHRHSQLHCTVHPISYLNYTTTFLNDTSSTFEECCLTLPYRRAIAWL